MAKKTKNVVAAVRVVVVGAIVSEEVRAVLGRLDADPRFLVTNTLYVPDVGRFGVMVIVNSPFTNPTRVVRGTKLVVITDCLPNKRLLDKVLDLFRAGVDDVIPVYGIFKDPGDMLIKALERLAPMSHP